MQFGSCAYNSGNTWSVPSLIDLSMDLPKMNYSQENYELGILICKIYMVDLRILVPQQRLQSSWGGS